MFKFFNIKRPVDFLRIISIFLLIIATFNCPYHFYFLVKVVVFLTSIYIAYIAHFFVLKKTFIIFIIISLVFNPIAPLHFPKNIWIVVDLFTAVYFLGSLYIVHFVNIPNPFKSLFYSDFCNNLFRKDILTSEYDCLYDKNVFLTETKSLPLDVLRQKSYSALDILKRFSTNNGVEKLETNYHTVFVNIGSIAALCGDSNLFFKVMETSTKYINFSNNNLKYTACYLLGNVENLFKDNSNVNTNSQLEKFELFKSIVLKNVCNT